MRELRLSIPFVGGVTVVYTAAEVEQKKQAIANHSKNLIASTKSLIGIGLGELNVFSQKALIRSARGLEKLAHRMEGNTEQQ